jgi:hypothetical protein
MGVRLAREPSKEAKAAHRGHLILIRIKSVAYQLAVFIKIFN